MRPALVELAHTISRNGETKAILAFGLDEDVPDDELLVHVPTVAARQFIVQSRAGIPLTPQVIAAAAGIPIDAVAETVCVVFSRRRFGWTTLDAADLAALLEPLVGAVLLTVAAGGLIQSATELGALLRDRQVEPLFLGLLPPTDGLTHGGPVAVLSRPRNARQTALPRVVAFVHTRNQDVVLAHTLASLVQDGIEPIVIDHGPIQGAAERSVTWLAGGARSVEHTGDDPARTAAKIERLAAESGADWCIVQNATERISGPWQALGLRASLAKLGEFGYHAASATVIVFDEHPGREETEDFGAAPGSWRFSTDSDDFHRIVAWQPGVETDRPGPANPRPIDPASRKRAPYNLLLRRYESDRQGAAESRDGSDAGDGVPAVASNPDRRRFVWLFWDPAGFEHRFLVERLTGYGIFQHVFPRPPGCQWWTEESITSWDGSFLKAGVARLPSPDPMNDQTGLCLVRWDTVDGQPASLWVQRPGQVEQFAGRGPSGTISFDGIIPNRTYQARLYTDDRRQTTLGTIHFGFRMASVS